MEITFFKWFIGILLVLSNLITIANIDKPREPITRTTAVVDTLLTGWILYLIITL